MRAVPNASRNEVVGWHGGALKIKVMAPPEGGRANKEITETLAARLGLPKRAVSIIQGETSRDKRLHVEGFTIEAIKVLIAP